MAGLKNPIGDPQCNPIYYLRFNYFLFFLNCVYFCSNFFIPLGFPTCVHALLSLLLVCALQGFLATSKPVQVDYCFGFRFRLFFLFTKFHVMYAITFRMQINATYFLYHLDHAQDFTIDYM